MSPQLFTLALPLLLLKAELLGCSPAPPHVACGWGAGSASLSFGRYNASEKNREAGCSLSSGSQARSQLAENLRRVCPDYFAPLRWESLGAPRDSLPALRYSSSCQCGTSLASSGSNLRLQCRPARLPVSSLEPAGGGPDLRLVTRLLGAGCATLHPPRSPKPPHPEPLTGRELRRLNDMLGGGRSVYQPVSCQLARTQSQPQFVINAEAGRLPKLLPDVRCPCPGQHRVELPFWVLRRTGDGGQLKQSLGSVGVSCAVPP